MVPILMTSCPVFSNPCSCSGAELAPGLQDWPHGPGATEGPAGPAEDAAGPGAGPAGGE